MDKKLLEELDIHEDNPVELKRTLKRELANIDQKLGYLSDDNPKAAELKNLYSRIEKAIKDMDKDEVPKEKTVEEYLPKERDVNEDSLPVEKGKDKVPGPLDSLLGKVAEKTKEVKEAASTRTDHEKELEKQAKEIISKNKQEQKKDKLRDKAKDAQDKKDKKDNAEDKKNQQISQAFTDGMLAFRAGNYQKAVGLFDSVINHYDNTKENKVEAGEASYVLSKIYGDKKKGLYDSPREDFYLEKSAKDLRHPEAMVDYGIFLASKLSSMPGIDDTALKFFERAAESERANDKTKNLAKQRYVETCERYKGFKNSCILKAAGYCRDLAKLEKESYLKQNWVKRETELKKSLKGIHSVKNSLKNNILGNLISGALFILVLLMGNIGYMWEWEPVDSFKLLNYFQVPFLAPSIDLGNPGKVMFSLSPFHKSIGISTDEETVVFIPFANLEFYDITSSEAASVKVPDTTKAMLRVPNAEEIIFSDKIYEVHISGLTKMSELTIPEGVHTVELYDCPGLTTVNLPESVTSFIVKECYNLTQVNAASEIPESKITYTGEKIPENLVVPNGFKTVTVEADSARLNSIVIGDGAKEVNIRVESLYDLQLPSTVETFTMVCRENIYSLTLPENTKEAGISIQSLEELYANNQLETLYIGGAAMTSYTVPESVTRFEIGACEQITNLVIPATKSVRINNCQNLSGLVLPEGMTMEDIYIHACPLLGY